ncbi:hypothetical protein C1N74_03995 [Microbacterium sp. SGAir0570]|uniref:hypothetical protein n=1 Tax=Microbacterium sp. SGAir0570 TaxID=2070348 RepID=UPI0010CCEE07|nr:hypothetical protein [Microbacterium sp. SGAir0570]QCR39670.1 hypothetical protein C1N74_03995 [Microbacterium sp. SGAir0570]
MQVILKYTGVDGGPILRLVDNPTNLPPIAFEETGRGRIPRLGSQDLLRLAAYAKEHGWDVDKLELADVNLDPIEDEKEESRIQRQLVGALTGQGANAAVQLLLSKYPYLTVLGVHFVGPNHRGFVIRRNGVTQAEQGASPIDLVRPAWEALRLA